MTPVKILVITSDPAIKTLVGGALEGRGYSIMNTEDGQAGMKAATESIPDVLVLDVEASFLDLQGLVRMMRMRPESALTPVLFIGPQAPVEELIEGFQLGSDDFLAKPFEARELELKLAVANKLRQKAEDLLRPKMPENTDFSSPGLLTAFRGTLDQIGLPSILSLVEMERKTGMLVLVLEPNKEKARLSFFEGRVVRAAYDKKAQPKNAELIYELLAHPEGKFEFRNMVVSANDEIQNPTTRLLLEGARRIDEARNKQ